MATEPARIVVVVPAYNEETNLASLLRHVHRTLSAAALDHRIVVLDDGSRDRTPEVLRSLTAELPLIVETHAVNLGLGPALRDGLKRAMREAGPAGVIVTMDADESHQPSLIPIMLKCVAAGCDVVIASRYQPGSRTEGLAMYRVFISWIAGRLFQLVFPIDGVRDYTCGFRAYRVEALDLAYQTYGDSLVDQRGFQCMADMLLKLRRLPLRFGEVPMVLRYDLKKGESKMPILRTTLATLRLMGRRRIGK